MIISRPKTDLHKMPPPLPNIQRKSEIKILGITVANNKLSFHAHVTKVINSCLKTIYVIKSLKNHELPNNKSPENI